MKKEEILLKDCCSPAHKHYSRGGNSNPIYGLGVIGALFYFLSSAGSFSEVMIGIFKSVFWPAILMFELLTYYQF